MLLCYIDSITTIFESNEELCSAKKIPLAGDPADLFRVLNPENMLYEKFIEYSFVIKY